MIRPGARLRSCSRHNGVMSTTGTDHSTTSPDRDAAHREGARPVGRPRATPARPGASASEDILEAAAVLFSERGYAGTSTRQVAEAAGLRQATLYYHFGGKEDILLELLQRSVRPTLERAKEFLAVDDPSAALAGLVRADVATLREDAHNIGILYLLPEVTGAPFEPFRETRRALARVYGELIARIRRSGDGTAAATSSDREHPDLDGLLCIHQVESVIGLRRDGIDLAGAEDAIVRSCLRSAGVPEERIARILETER